MDLHKKLGFKPKASSPAKQKFGLKHQSSIQALAEFKESTATLTAYLENVQILHRVIDRLDGYM